MQNSVVYYSMSVQNLVIMYKYGDNQKEADEFRYQGTFLVTREKFLYQVAYYTKRIRP